MILNKHLGNGTYMTSDNFMGRIGYRRCDMVHCCYIKKFKSSYIILLLYVNDMLIASSKMEEVKKLKRQKSKKFDMKDLYIKGLPTKYSGWVSSKLIIAKLRSARLGNHFKLYKDH